VGIRRLRVRGRNGRELQLPSWAAWSARDPLTRRAMEQMLLGVSTRHYARSLETLPPGLTLRAHPARGVRIVIREGFSSLCSVTLTAPKQSPTLPFSACLAENPGL
jgi:hypothetical protein